MSDYRYLTMIDHHEVTKIANSIVDNVDKLQSYLDEIKRLSNFVSYRATELEKDYLIKSPYVVKRVIKYLSEGLSYDNSIQQTANDCGMTYSRVNYYIRVQKVYTSAISLYGKKYCIDVLKSNGFKVKEIAKILGISENHVYKLARTGFKIHKLLYPENFVAVDK